MNPWVFSGFLIFLLSRILILTAFDPYVTDVVLYFDQAKQALEGMRAYTDFSFPYPPLSLPLIYLPGLFHLENFYTYRDSFIKELFCVDLLLITASYLVMKRYLAFKPKQIFNALLLISFFGLMQGHLLYDRIDLGVALVNVVLLGLALAHQPWGMTAVTSNLGVLFKFIPFFPAGFLYLVSHSKEKWTGIALKLGLFLIPALSLIFILEHTSHPGIQNYLFEHGERGIQIESVWATPYMLAKVWARSSEIGVDTNFGAQHLKEGWISPVVVFFSKIVGFGIFALLGFLILKRKPKVSKELLLYTPTTILLVFLATQRVLSPQFFIWLIPFLAMTIIHSKSRSLLVGSVALYTLTYIGFDLGYWEFVKFNSFFVHIVAMRNVVLLIVTGLMLKQFFKCFQTYYTA